MASRPAGAAAQFRTLRLPGGLSMRLLAATLVHLERRDPPFADVVLQRASDLSLLTVLATPEDGDSAPRTYRARLLLDRVRAFERETLKQGRRHRPHAEALLREVVAAEQYISAGQAKHVASAVWQRWLAQLHRRHRGRDATVPPGLLAHVSGKPPALAALHLIASLRGMKADGVRNTLQKAGLLKKATGRPRRARRNRPM